MWPDLKYVHCSLHLTHGSVCIQFSIESPFRQLVGSAAKRATNVILHGGYGVKGCEAGRVGGGREEESDKPKVTPPVAIYQTADVIGGV